MSKKLNQEIGLVETIKTISQAYQEISVMKMQKIRNSVLYTRQYLTELSELFFDVKEAFKLQMELEKKKHHQVIEKNGKSALVLLSANTKFYGDIINKVSKKFLEYVKEDHGNNEDLIVVGKLGMQFIEDNLKGKPYSYFEIPENDIKLEDLKNLASALISYENITVFYGQFENVITQTPVSVSISGDSPLLDKKEQQQKKFLFEPKIKDIMKFFESQIVSSLMKQSVNESLLSRHASRILAMEEALTHIDSKRRKLYSEKKRLDRIVKNKKQIDAFSGSMFWSK